MCKSLWSCLVFGILALVGANACLAQCSVAAMDAIPSAESSVPEPAQAIVPSALGDALRRGHYVIYFRHTATDFSKNDAGMKGYDHCAN